jgi:hypothetical protein
MKAQLEKLRTEAAECTLIRRLATAPKTRELLRGLADHLTFSPQKLNAQSRRA